MTTLTSAPVTIQTSPQSVPSTPPWFGEVAVIAYHLTRLGILDAIGKRVRFARRRFGHYDVMDFVAVLIGYALSGEPTLKRSMRVCSPLHIHSWHCSDAHQLPHRSTLSRFLAAIDQATVEELRTLFLEDLLARPRTGEKQGGLWDRQGKYWLMFDVDGTGASRATESSATNF
jgi:hypothetical protein